MRRGVKIILGLVGGVVLLLVVAAVAVVFYINSIARTGVERGATHALGVETTLASADVGLFSGEVELKGLEVDNAAGFDAPHFLKLGEAGVAVDLASLRADTVVVPRFTLDSLDVNLQRKAGSSNYQAILDHLKSVQGEPSEPAEPGQEKKFVINELLIRNVSIHADVAGLPGAVGDALTATVPIKEIRLTDVGKTGDGVGGTGVTVSELASIVVQAVLAAAVESGQGIIPGDILEDLQGALSGLDGLEGLGLEVAGQAQEALDKARQDAEKAAQDAIDKGKKEVEKLGDDLKGLIPRPGEKK
jgi:hypothetical protein